MNTLIKTKDFDRKFERISNLCQLARGDWFASKTGSIRQILDPSDDTVVRLWVHDFYAVGSHIETPDGVAFKPLYPPKYPSGRML